MSADLTNPIFTNEDAARAHFEALRWPNGPVCPHCGSVDSATEFKGKSTRPGVYKCRECKKPFTATIGTLYERATSRCTSGCWPRTCSAPARRGSRLTSCTACSGSAPTGRLGSWPIASARACASCASRAARSAARTKWSRLTRAYVGGKARNRKGKVPAKEAVVALVERDGRVARTTSPRSRPRRCGRSSRSSSTSAPTS